MLCNASHRQHLSSPICEQNGGPSLQRFGRFSEGLLGLLSKQRNFCCSSTYSWSEQWSSRLLLEKLQRPQQLEIEQKDFSAYPTHMGPSQHGPLCRQAEHSTDSVFQLETGPSCSWGRRFPTRLERSEALCLSPLYHAIQASPSHLQTQGNRGSCDSSLEISGVVPCGLGDVNRLPCINSSLPDPTAGPSTGNAPSDRRRLPYTDGMEDFWRQWEIPGLSPDAFRLISELWTSGTRKAYRLAWNKWICWCIQRDFNPISTDVVHVINFLTELFESGLSYRTVNIYRSAISAGHSLIDGLPVGQNTLTRRIMRSIRVLKPPIPKYTSLWDVTLILQVLDNWGDNHLLSLKKLSFKLTTPLCLVSFRRTSDVRALDVNSKAYQP